MCSCRCLVRSCLWQYRDVGQTIASRNAAFMRLCADLGFKIDTSWFSMMLELVVREANAHSKGMFRKRMMSFDKNPAEDVLRRICIAFYVLCRSLWGKKDAKLLVCPSS